MVQSLVVKEEQLEKLSSTYIWGCCKLVQLLIYNQYEQIEKQVFICWGLGVFISFVCAELLTL